MMNQIVSNDFQSSFPNNVFEKFPEDLTLKIFLDLGTSSLELSAADVKHRKFFVEKNLKVYQIACTSFDTAFSISPERFSFHPQHLAVMAMADNYPYKALERAFSIKSSDYRKDALAYVVGIIAELDLPGALSIAYALPREDERSVVLISILDAIAVEKLETALQIARTLDSKYQFQALSAIAETIVVEDINAALDILEAVDCLDDRNTLLWIITPAMPLEKLTEACIERILKIASTCPAQKIVPTMGVLARKVREAHPEWLFKIWECIKTEDLSDWILGLEIPMALFDLEKTLKIIDSLPNQNRKGSVLGTIIYALIPVSPKKALAHVDALLIGDSRRYPLKMIVKAHALIDVEEALEFARSRDQQEIPYLLSAIVEAIAEHNVEKAEEIANSIDLGPYREGALKFIIPFIALKDLKRALALASGDVNALLNIVRIFIPINIVQAEALANELSGEHRELAFADIAVALAVSDLERALTMTDAMEISRIKKRTLKKIAEIIVKKQPEKGFEIVKNQKFMSWNEHEVNPIKKTLINEYPELAVTLLTFKQGTALHLFIETLNTIGKTDLLRTLKIAVTHKSPYVRSVLLASIAFKLSLKNESSSHALSFRNKHFKVWGAP